MATVISSRPGSVVRYLTGWGMNFAGHIYIHIIHIIHSGVQLFKCSSALTQPTRQITCITFMLRIDRIYNISTIFSSAGANKICLLWGGRCTNYWDVGWGGHTTTTTSTTTSTTATQPSDAGGNCTESTYRRFRKLTLEVKLVLKLEKFSVPAFSCNDILLWCVRFALLETSD